MPVETLAPPVRPRSAAWPLPDEGLVARARRGDDSAFLDIVSLYEFHVFALCWRLSGSALAAERIGQDVFLQAWREMRGRGLPRPGQNLGDWLRHAAVRRVCGDRGRSVAPSAWLSRGEEVPLPAQGSSETASLTEMLAMRKRLSEALARLPQEARWLVVLRDLDGHDLPELSDLLGESERKIRDGLRRGRLLLTEQLTRLEGERVRPIPGSECVGCRLTFCDSLDGEALDGETALHLSTCGDCARLRESLYRHLRALRGNVIAAPSPHFREGIIGRLRAERRGVLARLESIVRRPSGSLAWGAVGVLVTLVGVFGAHAVRSWRQSGAPARQESVRSVAADENPVSAEVVVSSRAAASVPDAPKPAPPGKPQRHSIPTGSTNGNGNSHSVPPSESSKKPVENDPPVAAAVGGKRRKTAVALTVDPPTPDGMGAFNVTISYSLSKRTFVRLSVSNSESRQVALLVDAQKKPGKHTVVWHARGDDSSALPPGEYLVRALAAGNAQIAKVELPKSD